VQDSTALKELKKKFIDFTCTSESTASKYLKTANGNLNQALDAYYSVHPSLRRVKDQTKVPDRTQELLKIFEAYKDSEESAILIEGMERYCEDLEVDPTDIVMLVIAWHLEAEQMCEFKQEGFIKGWSQLQCYNIDEMKAKLPYLRSELDDTDQFQKIYQFAFLFGRNPGQRTLSNEVAIGLWELLLPNKFDQLNLWLEYISTEYKKVISKDTWNVLLEFIEHVNPDMSDYDPTGAWPLVYDEFVEYVKRNSA